MRNHAQKLLAQRGIVGKTNESGYKIKKRFKKDGGIRFASLAF